MVKHPAPTERIGGTFRYEIRLMRSNGQSIIFNVTVESDEAAVERARHLMEHHEFDMGEVWYAMVLIAKV